MRPPAFVLSPDWLEWKLCMVVVMGFLPSHSTASYGTRFTRRKNNHRPENKRHPSLFVSDGSSDRTLPYLQRHYRGSSLPCYYGKYGQICRKKLESSTTVVREQKSATTNTWYQSVPICFWITNSIVTNSHLPSSLCCVSGSRVARNCSKSAISEKESN